jgi:copper(I)-binding protein
MGKETDRLLAASSQFSAKTEVHEMSMDNGVMRMRELPKGIEIKAGETLTLKSGSYHIMFMGLAANLKAGEAQKATLVFEKAGKIEVDFNVEAMAGMHHAH